MESLSKLEIVNVIGDSLNRDTILSKKQWCLDLSYFFYCDKKYLELKKEGINWLSTNWADYMDPNAMTTLLADAIYNIEEEEYWEACQHALKNPYEARTNDENEDRREAPSDDGESSNSKSDNSGDNSSSDNGDSGDNTSNDSDSGKSSSEDYDSQDSGNDRGEPLSDREDEDVGSFYEDRFDDDVNYNKGDIEDDAEAKGGDIKDNVEVEKEDVGDDAEAEDEDVEKDAKAKGIDYDEYPYE